MLKVSARSSESDPSCFLTEEDEERASLLAEEKLGFKVSNLKSEPPLLEKPFQGFLAGWNSILLKTAEAEEDETAEDLLLLAASSIG